MSLRISGRGGARTLPTRASTPRIARLAASRAAYDARRRTKPLDPQVAAERADYAAILRRDPCAYCGGFCGDMAADHIEPLERDGEDTWANLTAAGRRCNASKKNRRLLLWMAQRPPQAG